MQIIQSLVFVIILTGLAASSDRKKRNIVDLLDLIDDYCESETICIDDVSNDLIYYVSGEGYDDEQDSGTSLTTVLLEAIDDRCETDENCFEELYAELKDRVLDDPIGSSIGRGYDDDDEEEYDAANEWEDDEDEFEDDFEDDDELNELYRRAAEPFDSEEEESAHQKAIAEVEERELREAMNQIEDIDKREADDWLSEGEEWASTEGEEWASTFERFEEGAAVDETVINVLEKDECLDNRADCQKWVNKEEKLGESVDSTTSDP